MKINITTENFDAANKALTEKEAEFSFVSINDDGVTVQLNNIGYYRDHAETKWGYQIAPYQSDEIFISWDKATDDDHVLTASKTLFQCTKFDSVSPVVARIYNSYVPVIVIKYDLMTQTVLTDKSYLGLKLYSGKKLARIADITRELTAIKIKPEGSALEERAYSDNEAAELADTFAHGLRDAYQGLVAYANFIKGADNSAHNTDVRELKINRPITDAETGALVIDENGKIQYSNTLMTTVNMSVMEERIALEAYLCTTLREVTEIVWKLIEQHPCGVKHGDLRFTLKDLEFLKAACSRVAIDKPAKMSEYFADNSTLCVSAKFSFGSFCKWTLAIIASKLGNGSCAGIIPKHEKTRGKRGGKGRNHQSKKAKKAGSKTAKKSTETKQEAPALSEEALQACAEAAKAA